MIPSGIARTLVLAAAALWLPSTALAQLKVSVMPSNSQNASYANAAINQPIQVWGRAWGGTAPYTYTLTFGDGTPNASGAVGNLNDIGAAHTFTTAGTKTFTLTVSDSAGATINRSGSIRVYSAPTQDQRVSMAIEKALRYLYLSQNPSGADQCFWQGDGGLVRGDYTVGATAASVLAFEENGHRPGKDPVEDIYAPTVKKGLDWLTHVAGNYSIASQPYGNPDTNGNGVGTYLSAAGHDTYANAFAALALIASEPTAAGAQARTIPTGPLAGKSYYQTVQDIIDLFNFAQSDAANYGSWQYSLMTSNSGPLDGSAMQWPALVSRAATDLWGIATPSWVTNRNAAGFKALQNTNGGIGYSANNSWINSAKTGGAMVAWELAGLTPDNDSAVAKGLDFIEANYHANTPGTGNSEGSFGQWYGMWGLKKGLQLQGISTLQTPTGARDWQADYDSWLLGESAGLAATTATSYRNVNSMFGQRPDGSWLSTTQWPGTFLTDPDISTAHAVLILTRSVTVALPVAVIAEVHEVSTKPGQRAFQMDGSASFHSDPTLSIQDYRWDFDASNGVDFDNPDATGAVVTNPGYTATGSYTVSLQVRDNSDPQRIGQTTELVVAVDTDVGPTSIAIPAGRISYNAKPGDVVTFDGSASFDPDGDPITLYEWDLDGDGQFDDATGKTPQVVAGAPAVAAIRLRVTALGKTGVSPEVPFIVSLNDLSVVSLTASGINPGVSADITVTIGNQAASGNAFNNVLVRFYNGNPLSGGAQLGGNFLVNLPVGGTVPLIANDLPLGGAENVYVFVDANGQVSECDESNNVAFVNATNSPPVAVAKNLVVPANASNQGLASAEDFDGGSSDPDGDSLTFSVSPAGPYPLGVTPVTLTVSDGKGESDTATATIKVVDVTPPVITLLGNNPQVIECPAPYTELGATAADIGDGNLSASIVIDTSGVNLSTPGTYQVAYNVSDAAGNSAVQVIRTVIVQDTTPPVISLVGPNPQVMECGNPYVEAGATAIDARDGVLTGAIVINSSGVNPSEVGTYLVAYQVSDAAGNAAVMVFRTVIVEDTTPPVITLTGPNPQVIECPAPYSELGATATDIADGDLSASIVIDSSAVDTSTPGTYPVTYNVSDAATNGAVQVVRTVIVQDTTPPAIALVGLNPQVMECGDPYVEAGATAFDAADGDLTGAIVIDSSGVNPSEVGSYLVTYDVIDVAGNAAAKVTRTVNVVDTTPPVLSLIGLANVTLECGVDSYTELGAVASDVGDPAVSVVIGGDAVHAYASGVYTVTYDAMDASGNTAVQLTRTVTVVDTTPPVIACPGNIEVPTLGPLGAVVNFTVTANDAGDPAPQIVCTPASGSLFPVGETTVTCTTIDAAGLMDSCSFVVKVLSAEALLDDLIEYVRAMPIHHGTKNAFLAKLLNSRSSLQRGRTNAAINQLEAFISHVADQSGDKLTVVQANDLRARALVVHAAITGVPYGQPYLITFDFGLGFEKYAGAGVLEDRLTIFSSQVEGLAGSSTLLEVVWDGTGELETSLTLDGPWTEVEFAEPPYWHAVNPEEPKRFFRIKRPDLE